jgi:phenylalanyl-tRNA synthetase beta chain
VDPIFSDKMHLDINEVFGFQLDLDLLMELANKTPLFNSIVSYPLVERDLNFVLDENILIGKLISAVIENGKDILKSADPINIFRHNSLGDNKKSVTINLVFQSSTKTLEDKDVKPVIEEIIRGAEKEFLAKLRT